jgi:hypothetical protein
MIVENANLTLNNNHSLTHSISMNRPIVLADWNNSVRAERRHFIQIQSKPIFAFSFLLLCG